MKPLSIILVLLFGLPVAIWTFYEPVRVLMPGWVEGVSCCENVICLDDASRFQEASALYRNAVAEVSVSVGPFRSEAQVVFCAEQACFRAFGFERASAQTVGAQGIVIGPRGWALHYLRHEMIHHRQAEELGALSLWFGPQWLIEGMAYHLSDDPRRNLAQPWQQHRTEFAAWYQGMSSGRMWEEARRL